ncbi:MAG: ribulose-phosphate 3-epimerase [Micrococcales bacterium]|nr:ribulose-phosphate 3-epimerase [Micrococcales bacterium]
MPVQINPSILSADAANYADELARIATADAAHVDVMDGHFVPNLTLGLPLVARLAQVSPIPLDVHLMIDDADRWAPQYAEAGAASVTFHAEATQAPVRLARELRAGGVRAAVAVRPATGVEPLLDLLGEFDMVLVMTVEPGFGGQSFIEGTLAKVSRLRQAIGPAGPGSVKVQVDGGVCRTTIARIARAGADVFVAGSAVYGSPDPAAEIAALRLLADAPYEA